MLSGADQHTRTMMSSNPGLLYRIAQRLETLLLVAQVALRLYRQCLAVVLTTNSNVAIGKVTDTSNADADTLLVISLC